MKKLIPFIILTFSILMLNSCFKANDNIGHGGRCTGSAYCTACSNCSGCGHCNSGGTCGVCRGGSSGRSSSSGSSSKSKSKNINPRIPTGLQSPIPVNLQKYLLTRQTSILTLTTGTLQALQQQMFTRNPTFSLK